MHRAIILGFLASGLVGAAFAAGADSSTLQAGQAVERQLSGHQAHTYAVSLNRGQFLSVAVEQRLIDVVVTSLDPDGREILEIDRPNGSRGVETLSVIAGKAGTYGIRVHPLYEDPAIGSYAIRIVALRPATSDDRDRVAAERAIATGPRLEREGHRREALALYTDAVNRFARIGDSREQSVALFLSAIGHAAVGEVSDAAELYQRALDAAKAASDPQMEARVLCRWGLFAANTGRPAEGLDMLESGLVRARGLGDRETEIEGLNGAGYVAYLLGRYQTALERYQRSLPLAREARLPTYEAWAHFGFGFTYWALNEPEKSIRSYAEALAIWRGLKNPAGEAVTLQGLSLTYWSVGAAQKAYDAVVQTLPVVRALHDRPGEALALCNLGLAEAALGKPAAGRDHFREAYDIWTRTGDPRRAWAICGVAQTLESLGEHESAAAVWNEALSVSRALGNRTVEAGALSSLARSELARQDLASARRHAEEALVLVEAIRGEVSSEALRNSFLAAKQDSYAVLVDVLLALDQQQPGADYASLAFAASERGRMRGLLEAISEAHLDLAAELPAELRRREQELEQRIRDLRQESGRDHAVGGDDERLSEAEEEWDRLVAEMRLRTPRYASLVYPQPASAERTAALLDATSALVSYAISGDRIVVFLLEKKGLRALRLPGSPADLTERVENYVGLMARGTDGSRELGRRLYGDLVEPWRKLLDPNTRRVVIVPDGALNSLPFESLPTPNRQAYLAQELTISYAPSATVLTAVAADSRASGAGHGATALLVLADPTVPRALVRSRGEVDGGYYETSPLASAAAEARAVFRYGGPGSELKTGPEASERFVRSASLEPFGVIHFATHALLDHRVPSRSALLLAESVDEKGSSDDGLLPAREIYRLRLSSELVVLSACQTARGRILPGEGVQGLAQAFFHAGARSVVASLWDVSDRRTADLMSRFYGHLADGESKALALQSAKLDLLRHDPRLAPRYWAPFVLIGEPNGKVPLKRASAARRWEIAAVGMGIVAALWTLSRRRSERGVRDAA